MLMDDHKTLLEKLKWDILDHLPYSLDLVPSDFHVSKTKNPLKGCYFESLQDGQEHGAKENCIIMNFKTCTPY